MAEMSPLHERLQSRPYPKSQVMDEASLEWIRKLLDPRPMDVRSVIKAYKSYPNLGFEALEKSSGAKGVYGIHGYGHCLRVSIYCWLIIQFLGLEETIGEKQVMDITLAALFHDIGRVNDNTDSGHGRKSADWLRENFPRKFDPGVLSAIEDHSVDDSNDLPILLRVLKSADALDRYRLPKISWWPDYSRVPLNVADMDDLCRFITYSVEKIMLSYPDNQMMKKKVRLWLRKQGI